MAYVRRVGRINDWEEVLMFERALTRSSSRVCARGRPASKSTPSSFRYDTGQTSPDQVVYSSWMRYFGQPPVTSGEWVISRSTSSRIENGPDRNGGRTGLSEKRS